MSVQAAGRHGQQIGKGSVSAAGRNVVKQARVSTGRSDQELLISHSDHMVQGQVHLTCTM